MSPECESYQMNGPDFDIKYRIQEEIVWVRVSGAAVEDFYGAKGAAREKFKEHADDICEKIGADLAKRETKGQRMVSRYAIKSGDFARIMKAA
jgi:hypothetical protein